MNLRGVSVRRIAKTPETLASVQAVIEGAPHYSRLTTGAEPEPNAAANVFEALPPGRTYEDKHVLAVFLNDKQVGLADVIRGFPSPETAMLGLLLLSERNQGSSLGRSTYQRVEELIRTWPEIKRVRIGVVETNAKVLGYWQHMGFAATGETKPYSAGTVSSRVIVLERDLRSAA
jgi:diamine N-acetyltransferase